MLRSVELSDNLTEQNRDYVRALPTKLEALGCVRLLDSGAQFSRFSDDEVETLAKNSVSGRGAQRKRRLAGSGDLWLTIGRNKNQ